jgi:hypothetical protein
MYAFRYPKQGIEMMEKKLLIIILCFKPMLLELIISEMSISGQAKKTKILAQRPFIH